MSEIPKVDVHIQPKEIVNEEVDPVEDLKVIKLDSMDGGEVFIKKVIDKFLELNPSYKEFTYQLATGNKKYTPQFVINTVKTMATQNLTQLEIIGDLKQIAEGLKENIMTDATQTNIRQQQYTEFINTMSVEHEKLSQKKTDMEIEKQAYQKEVETNKELLKSYLFNPYNPLGRKLNKIPFINKYSTIIIAGYLTITSIVTIINSETLTNLVP